jgi:ubiquinone/menaquinone biosynthesis C-methylase UbiE
VQEFDPKIRGFYERGGEIDRFRSDTSPGPLEFERTKEILSRYLPPPPLKMLDVGGGPGAYAAWLVARGYEVKLIDPVPLHVEQARAADSRISAAVGDARRLAESDASQDVVLLMGPLYHLVSREDRVAALRETRRVLRPGGFLFAAAISRYAALLDLLIRLGRLYEPEVFKMVSQGVETGVFDGAQGDLFTTAYFHLPEELRTEIDAAGFEPATILNIEGPGFLLRDFDTQWADPARREVILQTARLIESKAEMLAASGHILTVARKAKVRD